ncbi:MAG: hypothetical protein WBS18_09915 [Candidatus Acidiferrales bacterium]
MLFAIAALFVQLQPIALVAPVTPAAATRPVLAISATAPDTRTSSTQTVPYPNLDGVRLVPAPSESSAALPALALNESSSDSSFSTIRIQPPPPLKPARFEYPESLPSRRTWLILSAMQHGAATFDAYTTRQSIQQGAVEEDPLMRPFAHSPAMYGAMQVSPFLLDYLARRMQRSDRNFVRHMWWLPQSVSTAVFIVAGVNNLHVARAESALH